MVIQGRPATAGGLYHSPPLTLLTKMGVYEIEFRLQHDCPYNNLSRKYPELVFAQWCNYSKEVLEISFKDLSEFQTVQDDIQQYLAKSGAKIIRKSFSGSNTQLIVHDCICGTLYKSVSAVLEKHNCLELQPTITRDGWEWYRMIAFAQNDIKATFDELGNFAKFEILSRTNRPDYSVRETFVVSTNKLFGELTGRQRNALVAALDNGYYRVPKKITTDEIAQRLGQPRTTYEEHLRKAESKVLRSVAPYLELTRSKN